MRNHWLVSVAFTVVALASVSLAWAAEKKYGPGVTDAEIKIGNTMPYSGPLSTSATIGRTEAAYFQMLNKHGGVNGRKITFISLDDAYSPPKTVEQVRKLVEQEQVMAVFGIIGTPTAAAVQRYLNERQVPELFIQSGAPRFDDPQHYPWTMSIAPGYVDEARAYAKYIWRQNLGARSVCSIRTTITAGPISRDSSKVWETAPTR
jgi:branched-chain amino acid transport system substrate-binding protein